MANRYYLLKSVLILNLVFTTLQSFAVSPTIESWQLRLERNGVRVWTQPVPGYQVDAYKARADLDIPIDKIFTFLSDVEGFKNWVSGVKDVTILERDESGILYYISVSTPFAQDRDYVGRITVEPPGFDGRATVRHQSVPGIVPKKVGTIRVADYHETWKLVRLDANKTDVSLEAFFDPGGQLPPTVVNWFVSEAPYKVFETMRKRLAGAKRG